MHSAQRLPAPPVHWRAFASNGASPARPQSDNGVAGLLPCQEPSDVEHLSHTPRTHTFFSCLLRATYCHWGGGCHMGVSRTLNTSQALPGLGVIPADPWVILPRAASAGPHAMQLGDAHLCPTYIIPVLSPCGKNHSTSLGPQETRPPSFFLKPSPQQPGSRQDAPEVRPRQAASQGTPIGCPTPSNGTGNGTSSDFQWAGPRGWEQSQWQRQLRRNVRTLGWTPARHFRTPSGFRPAGRGAS